MTTKDLPRVSAILQLQIFTKAGAADLSGHAVRFDATVPVMRMSLSQLHGWPGPANFDRDMLAEACPGGMNHSGPFRVSCDLDTFLKGHGLTRATLTAEEWALLQDRYREIVRSYRPAAIDTEAKFQPTPDGVLTRLRNAAEVEAPPALCNAAIRAAYRHIEHMRQLVADVAKSHVPDFHFLSHSLGNWLWDCPTSPIGMCVYPIDGNGRRDEHCQYCGDPEERK